MSNRSGRKGIPAKRLMTQAEEGAFRKRIANSLRSARVRLGLTQDELADRLGVSQGRINAFEHARSTPRPVDLPRLCHVLKTDPNTLLEFTKEETEASTTHQEATMRNQHQVDTIHREVGRGSQDIIYTEILSVGTYKCRIEIRSDVYRFQCHALASVWSHADLRWSEVASIHYSQMKTEDGLAYKAVVGADAFSADRDHLVDRLREVLA